MSLFLRAFIVTQVRRLVYKHVVVLGHAVETTPFIHGLLRLWLAVITCRLEGFALKLDERCVSRPVTDSDEARHLNTSLDGSPVILIVIVRLIIVLRVIFLLALCSIC